MEAENIEILLNLIRNYPELYLVGHVDYKNAYKKELAWRKIQEKTEIDETRCRMRMRRCTKGVRAVHSPQSTKENTTKKTTSMSMAVIIYLILGYFTVGFVACVTYDNTNTSKAKNDMNKWNYCEHPDCSVKNQHTMCLAANKQSPRLFASGMTAWMRYQILLLHNRHRDNIALGLEPGQPPATNMRKMYWDYELEQMAEVWARQCQKRHDECRNTIRFNVLQNMDVRPVVSRVTEAQLLSDAVGAWFSGSRVLPPEHVWSFRLSNCSSVGGCNAHWYSAAAWGSTWRVGCSQALCTARKRSCVLFRKKRRSSGLEAQEYFNKSMKPENILLRRTRYMSSNKPARFEDFATTGQMSTRDSPLHRGILQMVDKEKKVDDVNIIAFTFCNYGPAGNIDGFPMYEAGDACSNCPQGTHCGDKTHRALCAVLQDPDSDDSP